ncbi:DUF262 domain-containing protein [Azospirillum melinis]
MNADLVTVIDSQIQRVHTQSLDLSFNEIMDMYKSDELNISPEYQRVFRWTEGARSRFIESLLLEMPVPPIYFIEEEDGRYSLIDGLQRISSYLHFRGELKAPNLRPPVEPGQKLTLQECDIVEGLNGKTWDDLGVALQIRLKRAFVRVEVVRKTSDNRFKYHMFKRLNTGGVILSDQQLRNSIIRILGAKFVNFIGNLSQDPNFQECVSTLTDEMFYSAVDQELVLRFFSLKNWGDYFKHDVSEFLTDYMEGVTEEIIPFDYNREEHVFRKTFEILKEALGDKIFGFANKARTDINRGFSVYHFESFTVGMQKYLEDIDPRSSDQIQSFGELIRSIKLSDEFVKITTGGGKNSRGLLRSRIQFVQDRIGAWNADR